MVKFKTQTNKAMKTNQRKSRPKLTEGQRAERKRVREQRKKEMDNKLELRNAARINRERCENFFKLPWWMADLNEDKLQTILSYLKEKTDADFAMVNKSYTEINLLFGRIAKVNDGLDDENLVQLDKVKAKCTSQCKRVKKLLAVTHLCELLRRCSRATGDYSWICREN